MYIQCRLQDQSNKDGKKLHVDAKQHRHIAVSNKTIKRIKLIIS